GKGQDRILQRRLDRRSCNGLLSWKRPANRPRDAILLHLDATLAVKLASRRMRKLSRARRREIARGATRARWDQRAAAAKRASAPPIEQIAAEREPPGFRMRNGIDCPKTSSSNWITTSTEFRNGESGIRGYAYWIAVFSKRDPWRDSARQARRRMGSARQITRDDVLVEFLAACAAAAPLYPNRSCRIRSRCPHASQHRNDPAVAGNFPQGSDAL